MTQLWVLPENGLGNVWSETYACSADYIKMSNNCVRLFLYVPGCGLCAYDVTDTNDGDIKTESEPEKTEETSKPVEDKGKANEYFMKLLKGEM